MTYFLIELVAIVARILVLVIIVDSVLSFFMSPYHPVKETLNRILNPLYTPIRRVVKPLNGLDFSPLILIVLIQLIQYVINRLLITIL